MTPGARRPADASGRALTPRYTGDYLDGFGNRVPMLAVANPEENGKTPRLQMNRAPGFGILRFKRGERKVVLEAWPRWPNGKMFPGWPLELDAEARPAGGLWR